MRARDKKPDKQVISSVIFPRDLYRELRIKAIDMRLSMGELVRQAVRQYLKGAK